MPGHMNDPITQKNQEVINAFANAFGLEYWKVVERAGLTAIGLPRENRKLPYEGPTIAEMTGLNDAEKRALEAELFGAPRYEWTHHALRGLHGPADPGGGWVSEAYEVVRVTKPQAIKVMAPDVQPGEIAALRAINPNVFLLARLFTGQLHEKRGGGTPEGAARWFANEVADPGDNNSPLNRAYNSGIRYFEVHNEVNLAVEGQGVNWDDGAGFARFFNTVVDTLRPRYPEAKFGFPGLSPGFTFAGRPVDMWEFLRQANAATARADFMCCHFYWGGDGSDYTVAVNDLRRFCDAYPNKLVFCTEFSNNAAHVSREDKADQIAAFYQACRALPANLGGMFVYVLSWRADEHNEGFLRLSADRQRWEPTGMSARLGQKIQAL